MPQVMAALSDVTPFHREIAAFFLSDKLSTSVVRLPEIPKLCSNLERRILCETLSNAFLKAMNDTPTIRFSYRQRIQLKVD